MSDSQNLAEDLAGQRAALLSMAFQVKDKFPDLDPGFFDPDTGTWLKPVSPRELEVYKAVTPHPRIVAFLGLADYDGYISLQYHPLGDLWTYILEKSPPLTRRIQWAVEIAEGLAHLHAKSIVWADAHLRNILVTEDLHVVLADFAFSAVNPPYFHWFTTTPPPIFACPHGYRGLKPTYPDIFGFGVILYALLMNRFPWMADSYQIWIYRPRRTISIVFPNHFIVLLGEVKKAEAMWHQENN
ncbi:kinase-like protein [Hymenopellis radicata]|nr:kinase-like protein [Hymenopellis radicata]